VIAVLHIRRKNILRKKRLHHLFKIGLPFGAMWLCFVFMLVPGMQVRKLVYGSYQECIRVQIKVNGDAVPLAIVRRAVIAKLGAAVARNFKFAFKVIYPAANKGAASGGRYFSKIFTLSNCYLCIKDSLLR
jgi:hypothetical protein